MEKRLALPSGATCTVRTLSVTDHFRLRAAIPAGEGADSPAAMEANVRIALTRAVRHYTQKDGTRKKIVAKDFDDRLDNELCVEEVPDGDAIAIVNAVAEMTQEAGREAAPFPAGPAGADPV